MLFSIQFRLTQVGLVEEIEGHFPAGSVFGHWHQIRQSARQFPDGIGVFSSKLLLQKANQSSVSGLAVNVMNLAGNFVVAVQGPGEGLNFSQTIDSTSDSLGGEMESGLGGFGGIHGGSHASASSSDVFDQFDGVAPHVIGQAAHEFAQTQTVHLVRGEVARHRRVEEALADVFVDQAVNQVDMQIEFAMA